MNNIDAHEAGVRINQFETELKYVENVSEERQDQYREAQENVQVNTAMDIRLRTVTKISPMKMRSLRTSIIDPKNVAGLLNFGISFKWV